MVKPDSELASKLKAVPLFEGLSDRELRDVIDKGRQVDHRQDHEIVQQGHEGAVGFHLILDGQASVIKNGATLKQFGPGDYFGEISLLDGKPRTATVRADSALRTFSVSAWDFRPLLDSHPQLSHKLLLGLCAHVRAAETS